MQDKLVAVYDFATSNLDDDIAVYDDEINEVKAVQLVKIIVPFSWSTKVSSIKVTLVVSLSSSKASLAISRACTTKIASFTPFYLHFFAYLRHLQNLSRITG